MTQAIEKRLARLYPEAGLLSFYLFIAFVVARYVQIGARRDVLATIRFELVLGVIAIIVALVQLSGRKPEIGRAQPIFVLISLLFGAMIIQLPLAAAPVIARTVFMDRVIKFAIMTFLMVVMVRSPRGLRWFLLAFLFAIFYITLESVRGLITGGLVWENQGIMRLHGAVPIYRHPNSLGGVAMGTLPFVVFLMPHFRRWWQKLWLLSVGLTSLVCVVYSGSRTAYVGLLAFLFWWWLQSKRKFRFLLWTMVLGVAFVAILPQQYIQRFESIGGKEKEGASKATRIIILEDAWQIFLEHPLGVGIASFPTVRMREFGRRQDTHNLYLEVGTNLGVQGLIIFLALIWVMMKSFRQTESSFVGQRRQLLRLGSSPATPPATRQLAAAHMKDLSYLIATGQATGGFIFVRLVLGLFGMDLYEVYWWFAAGIAIILSGLELSTKRISARIVASTSATSPSTAGDE